MKDVKPADISGRKRKCLKDKINELSINSKNTNIRWATNIEVKQ
jgi:hypothetical protein